MGYGVVVCRTCRRAKAYAEGTKSTTCPTCGRRLDVQRLKTFYRTDDPEALREAVGRINARLAGEPEILEGILAGTLEAFDSDAPATLPGGRPRRAEEVARQAGAAGPFTTDAFRAALKDAGLPPDEAEDLLAKLVRADILYEPRPGTYALLAS